MASRRQRGWAMPGFGLSLQWPRTRPTDPKPHPIGDEDMLLRSALDNSADPAYCYTVRELTMLAWTNELTDMPDWERKIFDPEFTFEWKSVKVMTGGDVSRAMADWCVEEVKYHTHISRYNTIFIPALDGGVLKSDRCIHPYTTQAFKEAAATLRRDAGERELDMSLVDPYIFPFVWGRTRLLRKGSILPVDCIARCGQGVTAKKPPEEDCNEPDYGRYRNELAYSNRFQWLPFDVGFEIQNDGRLLRPRIESYINNVHPVRHRDLYMIVQGLIESFIPLFNRTIIPLKAPGYFNQRIHLVDFARDPFIKRDPGTFRPPEQRAWDDFLNDDGQFQRYIFVDLAKEFWNTGLQMILHMRDIELTPEEPEFKGEQWHVQGQTNERICASTTYIYSTSNLSTTSPPCLSFRSPVFTEEAIAAKGAINTPPFLNEIYGAKHGDPAIQTMGDITLREGRVITWPNTFQTRILPFSLDDRSNPGHCRIMTLHLIDPNRRIMSTSMVPCQRRDWWASEVRTSVPALWRLPREVFNMIIERVDDYPISMEEGLRTRDEFKAEREAFREKHTQAMEQYEEWDFWGEPGASGEDE